MQALLSDAAFAFPPTTADAYAAAAPRVPSRTFAPSHARTPCPAMSNPSDLPAPDAPIQPPAAANRQDGAPVDHAAPPDTATQTRSYVTPTPTSKKDVPAFYARKRARSRGPWSGTEGETDADWDAAEDEFDISAERERINSHFAGDGGGLGVETEVDASESEFDAASVMANRDGVGESTLFLPQDTVFWLPYALSKSLLRGGFLILSC